MRHTRIKKRKNRLQDYLQTMLFCFLVIFMQSTVLGQNTVYDDPVPPPGAYQVFNSLVASSPNPDIPKSLLCQDLKVIFVLDESGSIAQSGATPAVRDGVRTLGNALLNSGATLQIIEFSTSSTIVDLGLNTVTPTYLSRLESYLTTGYNGQNYNPVGATNWDDALRDVAVNQADLVIFFTDGYPTAYVGADGNPIIQGGSATFQPALDAAVIQANIVKSQGKHMFVVGVGPGIDLPNIQAISGADVFGGTVNVLTADYTTPPYEELAANLGAAVNAICGTELTLTKTASNSGVCAGEKVTFTTTVTNNGGSFNFDANNVNITDVYPNGYSNLEILSPATGANIISGSRVNYAVGTLASGQTVTLVVRATVDAPPGNYNNVVTATAFNANTVRDSISVISGYATNEINLASCSPIVVNNLTYTTTGTYTQTLVSAAGCDSVLTINFILNPATSSTENITACDAYAWNGQTYTTSGQYSFLTTNANGCDSTAYLNLTINNSASSSFSQTVCDQYTWNDQSYTQSGDYTQTLSTINNCDSVVTLHLTVNYSKNSEFSQTACGSYVWNGVSYNVSGDYTQVLSTNQGCDSTVTMHLTVNYNTTSTDSANVCNSYTWNGNTYSTSGTYTYVSTNAAGCTNTATLYLTIRRAPTTGAISGPVKVCRNQTFTYSVPAVPNATSYTWVLPTGVTGSSTSNTITVTIGSCLSSGVIKVRGNNDCGSGAYSQICISAYTSVPSTPGTITGNTSICTYGNYNYSIAAVANASSYSWTVSGTGLTIVSGQGTTNIVVAISGPFTSGTISVKSVNCLGTSCSAKTLCVVKANPPATPGSITGSSSVKKSQTSVCYSVAAVSGATAYEWTISGGATFVGATSGRTVYVNFSNSTSANIVISVRALNACGSSATSSRSIAVNLTCRSMSNEGDEEEISFNNADVNIFPNPTRGQFNINVHNHFTGSANISLVDMSGKVAYKTTLSKKSISNIIEVNPAGLAKGNYTLIISEKGKKPINKMIVLQ